MRIESSFPLLAAGACAAALAGAFAGAFAGDDARLACRGLQEQQQQLLLLLLLDADSRYRQGMF